MEIKQRLADIFDCIPKGKHKDELQQLQNQLYSLIQEKEYKIAELQKELQHESKTNKELYSANDLLRQDKLSLTAKIQSIRQEAASRQAIVEEQAKSVVKDMAVHLISFISDIDLLKSDQELSLEKGLRLLNSRYEEVLISCGITTDREYNGLFDASCQKAIGNKMTDDSSLVNHVFEVVTPGYSINGKCIQPMEVIVYSKQQ